MKWKHAQGLLIRAERENERLSGFYQSKEQNEKPKTEQDVLSINKQQFIAKLPKGFCNIKNVVLCELCGFDGDNSQPFQNYQAS